MRVAVAGGLTAVGRLIALRLVAGGHEVVVIDSAKPEFAADWIKVEFCDPATVVHAVDQLKGDFDALVSAIDWPLLKSSSQDILVTRFLSARLLLETMIERLSSGASILTVSSRAGWQWKQHYEQVQVLMGLSSVAEIADFVRSDEIDNLRAYALGSEALIAWTTTKTEELLSRGIRANTVSPAAVQDEYFDEFTELLGGKAVKNVERAGRVGQPDEVADVIEWLLSSKSSWIKGQDIIVDGGIGAMITSDKLQNASQTKQDMSVLGIATSPSVLKRSARIALVVGLVLAALNHGDRIFAGNVDTNTLLKICLTFFVPFCVSTYSSVLAVRSNMQRIQSPI